MTYIYVQHDLIQLSVLLGGKFMLWEPFFTIVFCSMFCCVISFPFVHILFCRISLLQWRRKVLALVAMLKPCCSHFGGWLSET